MKGTAETGLSFDTYLGSVGSGLVLNFRGVVSTSRVRINIASLRLTGSFHLSCLTASRSWTVSVESGPMGRTELFVGLVVFGFSILTIIFQAPPLDHSCGGLGVDG